MNILELAGNGNLTNLKDISLSPEDIARYSISKEAVFGGTLHLGEQVRIEQATIGANCLIWDGATILRRTYLGNNVTLESEAYVGKATTILTGSVIGREANIGDDVIIGKNVAIPSEAQLGKGVVVPSTRTIVALGRLGMSRRTVTIHGSDNGPRFSIGCQNSVSLETITSRITSATQTTEKSAEHYKEYLPIFSSIGYVVQKYYDAQTHEIQELRANAADVLR